MNSIDFNFVSNLRGFKIINWNIRSLLKNHSELECILSDTNIELICLCESWLNKNITNGLICLPNYNIIRLDRATKRKGGGLCMYIHHRLNYDVQKFSEFNCSNNDIELLIVCINLPCCTPIVVVHCYRPPSGNVDAALNHLSNCIDSISNCELFIVGDFNLDYAKPRSPSITKLKVMERVNQLKQYINVPTRISSNSKSIIDHIYSNSHIIANSGVIRNTLSDHFPCFIVRKNFNRRPI